MIRKQLPAIGKNKSFGPDGIAGEILKLVGEAMMPYLAKLLYITMNNMLSQVNGKMLYSSQITNGKSIGIWKIKTGQLILGG